MYKRQVNACAGVDRGEGGPTEDAILVGRVDDRRCVFTWRKYSGDGLVGEYTWGEFITGSFAGDVHRGDGAGNFGGVFVG